MEQSELSDVGAARTGRHKTPAYKAAFMLIQHPVGPIRPTPHEAASRARQLMRRNSRDAKSNSSDDLTDLRAAIVELADAAFRDQDWKTATVSLDWALALMPCPRLSFRLGMALFKLERYDACLESLECAARDPTLFERAQVQIVKVHHRRQARDDIIAACNKLLQSDPRNLWAIRQLYTQHFARQDFIAAKASFNAAHQIDPTEHPWALFELLQHERCGRITAALAPYASNFDFGGLPEVMKERLAQLFYSSGKHHPADLCAQAMLDQDAKQLVYAKLFAATGRPKFNITATNIPKSRAAHVVRALQAYLAGSTDQSIAALNQVPDRVSDRLAVSNFRSLITSGCVLSNRIFDPATTRAPADKHLPIVNQLWVGDILSTIEQLSIRSFIACGHEVHLYTYSRDLKVPPGCVLQDAEEIMPRDDIFVHSEKAGRNAGSLAGFADIFRWKLIHEKGGAWSDCDVICLQPIQNHRLISTELTRIEGVIVPGITNCFFAAERGDPVLRRAFDSIKKKKTEDLLWGEAGIHQMATLVAEQGWGDRLTSPSDICPIPYFRIVDALTGGIDVPSIISATNCRAVHLYTETMRDVGFEKSGPFPARSVVAYLQRRVSEREAECRMVKR